MIKRVTGDILQADAELIYIPVNRVGVMGAGLAKQFRDEYPELYAEYKGICDDTDWLHNQSMTMVFVAESPMFVMFPTKNHWKDQSNLQEIEGMLEFQFNELHMTHFNLDDASGFGVQTVAIPPLGAGLGGLDSNEVLDMIERVWIASEQDNVRTLLLYQSKE